MDLSVAQIVIWVAYFISLYIVIFWLLTYIDRGVWLKKIEIKRFPFVSIVVPVLNEEKNIIWTLDSLVNMNYPRDKIEIIVVNDASTDNSRGEILDYISKHKEFSIIYLENEKNMGKHYGVNRALSVAKGEFFVCLDADSAVHPEALSKMLPHFDYDENLAVVLPLMKIINPENMLQRIQWCEYLLNFFYKSLMSMVNCVHVAPGPFSVFRRDILIKLGGIRRSYNTEDFEVSLRIQRSHYKLLQVLDAEVYTKPPKTIKGFYRQRNRWYKGTMLTLMDYKDMIFNRKYGDFGVLQLPRVMLSGFLAVGMITFTGYRYVIKPLWKDILNWSAINFDFSVWLRNFHFSFNWLNIDFTNTFFFLISLSIGLIIILYAYYYTRERIFKFGFLTVPAYIVLYGIMASIVWCGVFIDLIFRKSKLKW